MFKKYQKSIHVPESIFRLIECYVSLGLVKQSYYFYKILEYNFPGSDWVKEAENIIKEKKSIKILKNLERNNLILNL